MYHTISNEENYQKALFGTGTYIMEGFDDAKQRDHIQKVHAAYIVFN